MTDLILIVDGVKYGGWKSQRATRSIESLAGSFAVDFHDRWQDGAPRPIVEGAACRVELDGEVIIDGYVKSRDIQADANGRRLAISGRDRAAELVDCSALLSQWTYRDVNALVFARKLAEPFGIKVTQQPGFVLPKVKKLVVSPGDTVYDAIRRAVGDEGALIVSDGTGGIRITRAAGARAAALVEGDNIESANLSGDAADRFHEYRIATQTGGTDEASGDATRVQASAFDDGVTRNNRTLLIRPEKGYSVADARKRADWEARIRAAKSTTVTVNVVGWRQSNGLLWAPNALTFVKAPSLIGFEGDLLISQVDYSVSNEGGQATQLKLVRPDAFNPEPTKARVKGGDGLGGWPELRKGAL